MPKAIKVAEKAVTVAAGVAWNVFNALNSIKPNASFTPKWSEKPLLKSWEKQKPPLGWPRITDSLCPKCVPEMRKKILDGELPVDVLRTEKMGEIKLIVYPESSPELKPVDHLDLLEAESIQIIREVAAEFQNPVMLYSIGKDSSVMVRLAQKAFFPGKLPFPLLHVNTTWKFREMNSFRDRFVKENGLRFLEYINQEGVKANMNPFDHGSNKYTDEMKTVALRQALDAGKYDAAIGGARRDEEKSRAKDRVFSFRDRKHTWDPKNQRPELWNLYNCKVNPGDSIRAFPLS